MPGMHKSQAGMVVHSRNVEAGGSEVQGYPTLNAAWGAGDFGDVGGGRKSNGKQDKETLLNVSHSKKNR